MPRIYLDYASTTPVAPGVLRRMHPYFSRAFGNPGSLHSFGQEAIAAVDEARAAIAEAGGVDFREVLFTGSATEANNLALRGAVAAFRRIHPDRQPKIVISAIEHESVRKTAEALREAGAEVLAVGVNASGRIAVRDIRAALDEHVAVVSIMYANNEIGVVADIPRIARAVREYRGEEVFPFVHTDAVQAFQFLPCRLADLGVDLFTLSAHKIYGPKGVGALLAREAARPMLEASVTGGGQEFGLRSGTENVAGIAGFAEAVREAERVRTREGVRIRALALRLASGIRRIVPGAKLNGPGPGAKDALPNIVNFRFPGRAAEELITRFDLLDLAVSSGSACASRSAYDSATLRALGGPAARVRESIRFSLGRGTLARHISAALAVIQKGMRYNTKKGKKNN